MIKPVHPGEIIKEDYLVPLGMSVEQLAQALGIDAAQMNEIIRGERGITADTAMFLGRYFATNAEYWLNLQSLYDLRMAQRKGGPPDPKSKTILVVDDEPAILKIAKRYLERAGFDVITAKDGREALELCRDVVSIDLLLTDADMPRMDGAQLAAWLRGTYPGTPILFMTGLGSHSDLVSVPKRDGYTVLRKPFESGALIKAVSQLLSS